MRIVSFNEIVQVEHKVITRLGQYDILPGSVVTAQDTPDGLSLTTDAGTVTVPDELGHAIRVIVEEA